MVLRSAGEVGCAHCAKMGADQACQVCTRLVCDKCAADWATCAEPSGRVVRLGMTARVRDVDPVCRYALVSHWRKPLRLFDLRMLSFASAFQIGALSRDGQYFAAAGNDQLTICNLDMGTQQVFNDHTDEINAVRFAADDHVLVSADTDHRIVLRPRTSTGYATPLLAVEVDA